MNWYPYYNRDGEILDVGCSLWFIIKKKKLALANSSPNQSYSELKKKKKNLKTVGYVHM